MWDLEQMIAASFLGMGVLFWFANGVKRAHGGINVSYATGHPRT
jgi:hypothetical protein